MVKVICAGFPRTGTTSIAAALRILGYKNVYDHEEALQFGFEEWGRILSGDSQNINEVLDKIYPAEVEAVVDLPHSFYFEYFYKKWPDAKVILLHRNEDAAYVSLCNSMAQRRIKSPVLLAILKVVSPTVRKINKFYDNLFITISGSPTVNELKYKMAFRRHNIYVKSVVSSENLLEYNISEGWDKLCAFLNKPVPKEEFPKMNKTGDKNTIAMRVNKTLKIKENINKDIKHTIFSFLSFFVIAVSFLFYFCNY